MAAARHAVGHAPFLYASIRPAVDLVLVDSAYAVEALMHQRGRHRRYRGKMA
jgi:hypothetical protein